MAKDDKKKKKKVRKTTSKDVPGNGMAKKAAEAMEKRQRQIDKIMKNI